MVEHVPRQGLAAGPGEGPEGRRQADLAQFLFGLLPDRHRLMGEMQPDFRHQRRRHDRGIGADEGSPVGDGRVQAFTPPSLQMCLNSSAVTG